MRSSSKPAPSASASRARRRSGCTPTLDPSEAGLTYSGKSKRSRTRAAELRLVALPLLAAQRQMVEHGQARLGEHGLGGDLVHRGGGGANGRAHVGQLRQLQSALQAAVLALGAVRGEHDHVELDRLGSSGARAAANHRPRRARSRRPLCRSKWISSPSSGSPPRAGRSTARAAHRPCTSARCALCRSAQASGAPRARPGPAAR